MNSIPPLGQHAVTHKPFDVPANWVLRWQANYEEIAVMMNAVYDVQARARLIDRRDDDAEQVSK